MTLPLTPRRYRSPFMLVAGGVLAMAVADSVYTYLTLQGTSASGGPIDAVYVAGYLLLAVGRTVGRALVCHRGRRHDRRADSRVRRDEMLIPQR